MYPQTIRTASPTSIVTGHLGRTFSLNLSLHISLVQLPLQFTLLLCDICLMPLPFVHLAISLVLHIFNLCIYFHLCAEYSKNPLARDQSVPHRSAFLMEQMVEILTKHLDF